MKKNSNLLKFAQKEARLGKKFADGSIGFKFIKFFYCLAVVYTVMMSMAIMFGNYFKMTEYAAKINENMTEAYNQERMYFITLVITIIITISSAIFMKLKLAIPMGIAGCVHVVVAFTVFYGPNKQVNYGQVSFRQFWMPLGIPTIVCAVVALLMMVLYLVDKHKVNVAYEELKAKLYRRAAENDKNINPEEFEKILNEYRGEEINFDKPLKKSQKKKLQKQGAEMEATDNNE